MIYICMDIVGYKSEAKDWTSEARTRKAMANARTRYDSSSSLFNIRQQAIDVWPPCSMGRRVLVKLPFLRFVV